MKGKMWTGWLITKYCGEYLDIREMKQEGRQKYKTGSFMHFTLHIQPYVHWGHMSHTLGGGVKLSN
jgi:hypothetical protein